MTDVYLSVSDIEEILSISYTSAEIARMEKMIAVGTKAFETDVGVYSDDSSVDFLLSSSKGVLLTKTPSSTPVVYKPTGDMFNPTYVELLSSDYIQDPLKPRFVKLRYPENGVRYKVMYNSGYTFATVPYEIKYLVFLYTMLSDFETSVIANEGLDVTQTIDVDVYKKITKGNPYNGFGALQEMIQTRKATLVSKGVLKSYHGSNRL